MRKTKVRLVYDEKKKKKKKRKQEVNFYKSCIDIWIYPTHLQVE